MELNDSTRSSIFIDLNEISSSSTSYLPESKPDSAEIDSLNIVRSFHKNHDSKEAVALLEEEKRDKEACGACGQTVEREEEVACDGCERVFHLKCVAREKDVLKKCNDWICDECVSKGVKSKRWPLGFNNSKKIVFDINSSPPSDDERGIIRNHAMDDNSANGNILGAPVAFSNHFLARNGFEHFNHNRGSGSEMEAFRQGFEDIRHQTYTVDRNKEVTDLDFPLGRDSISNHTSIRSPSHRTNEILLQCLKEFISERHGILGEGWHVELKHLMSGYVAYCSPDGKIFGSMSEVACYLGLESSCKGIDTDAATDASPLQEALHLPKKKKSKRFSCANGSVEINELTNDCHRGLLSDGHQSREVGDAKFGKATEADLLIEDHTNSTMSDEGFPVQFEDFFVISLGKIDGRPSYHEHQLIWPVGYKSCWHDRVTGSLFVCEVLDGGDSGPVFKIKRFSCSAMPLPNGSTILCVKNPDLFAGPNSNEHNVELCDDMDCDTDSGIEAILADASAPTEADIMTCLEQTSKRTCSVQASEQHGSLHSEHGSLSSLCLQMADDIGEFTVEEPSSCSAWRLASQKLVEFYSKSCKQEVNFKLYCKHVDNKTWSPSWDTKDKRSMINFAPLAKFCSSPNLLGIPLEYEGGFDSLATCILKWLDQDRFGLDADFVQEIIEQLPGVDACSNYEFLADRSNYSMSSMVGNGLLMEKRKNGAELDDSFQRSKRPRLERNCDADDHDPPLGRLLCSRLPPVLVGDLYQVWEFLWRFRGILGLKEICSLGQLEEELINLQSKFTDDRVIDLDQVSSMRGPKSSPCQKLPKVITGDIPHVFVQVDKGATTDLSQDKHVSVSHKKCAGLALTDVHSSLLSVLIGELQSKVAAIVDPNFDSGELKSKRGRKKDVDSLTLIRRNKLTTLPINEMTWPELARRYILAFLTMEGNLDSSEITARESAKVFRCLQGDGGVLCGSLTGVAGMEADALLLAEATKQIYGSLNRAEDVLAVEDEDNDASGSCENSANGSNTPDWALVLEPVKKLPTNVGARIRKCVYEALEKGPPEWAKERLEYSISKDVYKGNASGPTKRAVLSVLAEISGEGLPQKPEKRNKRKITIPVSDIIMKQCRIILRRVAANDDGKVFCTLLGRNIIHSCDHEDEGLLGSPAMISRPLDFRTIDLRLAVGAYGGSHDSFLEDVQELWKNVYTAFREQSDVIKLAEKLSQNFESLYEKEVVTLIQKLEIFAKLDCLNAETKKELDNILASTNEIPKAPWDEGVCKVCGVDKDDNSVLLCDTCDAGYHTYCLNPPLARIPEGNWYCPSCVGVHMFPGASISSQVMGQTLHKKNREGITCAYLETLMDLATVIEEKDYGDFGVDERTFLLKFLCDEFLGSAFVRQHLEQCAEITYELQQKLRSLSVEWKNLKSREEFLTSRSTKMNSGASAVVKEGLASASTDQSKSVGQPPDLSQRPSNCFDGVRSAEGSQLQIGAIGFEKQPFELNYDKKTSHDSQTDGLIDTRGQINNLHVFANGINASSKEINNPLRKGQLLSNHSPQLDQMDDSPTLDDLKRNVHSNTSTFLPPSDHSGSSLVLGMNSVENVSSVNCESQAYHTELRTIKDDILCVQHSISGIESQLLRQPMRREFLGSDSRGRLYWASKTSCGHPQIIVDGSLTFHSMERSDHWFSNSSMLLHSSSGSDTPLNLEGSRACFPFLFNLNNGGTESSAWVFYETDAEIEELINWLGHDGRKGIELINSIRQWLKVSSQEIQQTINPVQDECQAKLSMIGNNVTTAFSNTLLTKAELFLEKWHGAVSELDASDLSKRHGRKSRGTNDEKTYRCDCLELIWLSRNHCNLCHRTFSSDVELKGHNDGKCSSVSQPHAKSEEVNGLSKGRGSVKAEVTRKENISETDKTRSVLSEIDSRLIKFQNRGIKHPYDLSDVCTKFITKDSNKELVQKIGLIGSNGLPSFVISMSPYVSDSVVMLISPEKDSKILQYVSDMYQKEVFAQGKRGINNTGAENLSDTCTKKTSVDESIQVLKINKPSLVCMQQRGKKSSSDKCLPELPGHYSLVPESSLKPQASFLLRRLKINLLDMEAALPEEALRPSKGHLERRWAWRAFVKSAVSIYQMVQATIMLEELIKTEYLQNEWWYWSSISAAAKSSTIASLALRIYALDSCVIYEKTSDSGPVENLKPGSLASENPLHDLDSVDKSRVTRKSNRKRKEPEDGNCSAKSNGS